MKKSEENSKMRLNLPSIGLIVAIVTLTVFITRLDSKVESLSNNLESLSNDVAGLSNDVAGLSNDLKESNIRQDLQIMKTNDRLDNIDDRLTNLVLFLVKAGVVGPEPELFTELPNEEPTLNDEKTRLHFAAYQGDVKAIPDLLNEGAVINARDEDDETPLHYAARKDHGIVLAALLDAGADPTLRDEKGRLPIDIIKEDSPLYHTPIWERLNGARSDS